MIIFTPNTVIKSGDVNTNFAELKAVTDVQVWKYLGSSELALDNDTISISGFYDYDYVKVVGYLHKGSPLGSIVPTMRLDNESGTHYDFRYFANGTAGSAVNQTSVAAFWSGAYSGRVTVEFSNLDGFNKIGTATGLGNAAGGIVPDNVLFWWKYTNIDNDYIKADSLQFINTGASDFGNGSELVLYGRN
jgi:hypothetical protein